MFTKLYSLIKIFGGDYFPENRCSQVGKTLYSLYLIPSIYHLLVWTILEKTLVSEIEHVQLLEINCFRNQLTAILKSGLC